MDIPRNFPEISWTFPGNYHNGPNVGLHIETDPSHVETDVFSCRYLCFSYRCTSVRYYMHRKPLFHVQVMSVHIGTDVNISCIYMSVVRISCRTKWVSMCLPHWFSCRSLVFSCRYRFTSASIYMSIRMCYMSVASIRHIGLHVGRRWPDM